MHLWFTALAAISALLSSTPVAAQSGAARYAGVQLEIAQSFLRQARIAAARPDFARAGKLAWQAGVDARLAWAMADSSLLREEAAEVSRDAATLVDALAASSRDRAAASYPSISGLAQSDAPRRR